MQAQNADSTFWTNAATLQTARNAIGPYVASHQLEEHVVLLDHVSQANSGAAEVVWQDEPDDGDYFDRLHARPPEPAPETGSSSGTTGGHVYGWAKKKKEYIFKVCHDESKLKNCCCELKDIVVTFKKMATMRAYGPTTAYLEVRVKTKCKTAPGSNKCEFEWLEHDTEGYTNAGCTLAANTWEELYKKCPDHPLFAGVPPEKGAKPSPGKKATPLKDTLTCPTSGACDREAETIIQDTIQTRTAKNKKRHLWGVIRGRSGCGDSKAEIKEVRWYMRALFDDIGVAHPAPSSDLTSPPKTDTLTKKPPKPAPKMK